METLQLLEACYRRQITLKQAFSFVGLSKVTMKDKSFNTLTEEEVFACIMNWIINKLKRDTRLDIRTRVEGKIYQAKIHFDERNIRVKKPVIIEEEEGSMMYDWPDEATFNTLTVDMLTRSMMLADRNNYDKKITNWTENAENVNQLLNVTNVTLTEEDLELVNELLDC